MLKSVAISDAGMTKQSLYEVDRRLFTPATYDRAMESLDAVNGEIEQLIHSAWGRGQVVGLARCNQVGIAAAAIKGRADGS